MLKTFLGNVWKLALEWLNLLNASVLA